MNSGDDIDGDGVPYEVLDEGSKSFNTNTAPVEGLYAAAEVSVKFDSYNKIEANPYNTDDDLSWPPSVSS